MNSLQRDYKNKLWWYKKDGEYVNVPYKGDGWIDPKDLLPEPNIEVLTNIMGIIKHAMVEPNFHTSEMWFYFPTSTILWQPLPEPYNEP